MPPMDPQMGNEPPMDPQMGQDPMMDMGGNEAQGEQGSDGDELMSIINSLSLEDKAAVEKYAKSMADKSSGEPQNDGMPMEGKIRESMNQDSQEPRKRDDKKLNDKYRGKKSNPFVSPF